MTVQAVPSCCSAALVCNVAILPYAANAPTKDESVINVFLNDIIVSDKDNFSHKHGIKNLFVWFDQWKRGQSGGACLARALKNKKLGYVISISGKTIHGQIGLGGNYKVRGWLFSANKAFKALLKEKIEEDKKKTATQPSKWVNAANPAPVAPPPAPAPPNAAQAYAQGAVAGLYQPQVPLPAVPAAPILPKPRRNAGPRGSKFLPAGHPDSFLVKKKALAKRNVIKRRIHHGA